MKFELRMVQKLNRGGVRFAVVGCFALQFYHAARRIHDLDILIDWRLDNLQAVDATLTDAGLQSKWPIDPEQMFRRRGHYLDRLKLREWSFYNPKQVQRHVDVLIFDDLHGKTVQTHELDGVNVPVLDVDDLIEMKKASDRPQDKVDVQQLLLHRWD